LNRTAAEEETMPAPARKALSLLLPIALVAIFVSFLAHAGPGDAEDLDTRVEKFLATHDWGRGDMNVPAVDGQILHDIIVENKYTKALEIGTSTGHSAVWIAWALSKTGGKLITLEIDERRYREALDNFEAAGLSEFVDARLGDAHEIVPALEGPFDFVFSDADKGWYKNYFDALLPALEVGGCYTSHNVSTGRHGMREYLDYLLSVPNLETIVDERGAGLSISLKKPEPIETDAIYRRRE
jgi:predicted O-methyltransferase YrrM